MLLQKIFSFFLALLNMFMLNTGIKKIPVQPITKPDYVKLADNTESAMCSTAEYAYNAKNSVQAVYTNPERNAYRMSNDNIILTHKLTGAVKNASITDKNGNAYIENSFTSFCTDKAGIKTYFETSVKNARVNTIRLGIYYYECHIRDLDSAFFNVDKAFHVYADKLYMQYTVLAKLPTNKLKEFGSEITIPYSKVNSVAVRDKDGTKATITNFDENNVEFAAFDIKDTGVIGFIVPSDGSTKKLTVSKGVDGYIIRQYANFDKNAGLNDYKEEGGNSLNSVTFGCRIYTDNTHSFTGIMKAAREERTPLTDLVVESGSSDAKYAGYDALRGAYTINMNGTDFTTAYNNPDRHYTAPISIKGGKEDRTVYFRAFGNNGCLEAAALLDEDNTILPIEVEVCKNFRGDGGEPIYGAKDYQYGDAIFPVCIEKNQELSFTLIDLYQNWGKYPIKQLSSIEFHVSYYHLSTGTTESNCIAPYFVYEKDGWTLPDFRNRSGDIWETQPQFNSVGVLKFMTYRDSVSCKPVYSEFAGSKIDSTGLSYSDVTDTYKDDNGNYTYSLRHVEFPQTDENRTYYTLNVTFDKKVTYEDFRKDFDIFCFDGRFVKFNKASYLNKNNVPIATAVDTTEKDKYYTLGNDCPYMSFYNITDDTAAMLDEYFGCNFALIIRDSKITIRGGEQNIPFVFRETSDNNMTCGALTLDAGNITFNKGDSINIDMILLPWGTGRETSGSNVIRVREDSAEKPVSVTAQTGTVIEDSFVPKIKAENNIAEFTLSGGRNNNAVVIEGFTSLKTPIIQKLENGQFVDYELASSNGYDGYTVRIDKDGTYSFSFIYTASSPDETNTFRITGAE